MGCFNGEDNEENLHKKMMAVRRKSEHNSTNKFPVEMITIEIIFFLPKRARILWPSN